MIHGKAFVGKPAQIKLLENTDEHSWIRLEPDRPHSNIHLPPMGTCVARHTDLASAA